MCGHPFREGGRYLIFASRQKETNYLSASICGWTRPLGKDNYFVSVIDELLKEGSDPGSTEVASKRQSQEHLDKKESDHKPRNQLLEESAGRRSSFRSLEQPRR
jgi:hypothetical protein